MDSTTFLLDFFMNPVVRVSQLLSKYELDDESSNDFWSGEFPVLVFTVDGALGERSLAIVGRDYDLAWRELDATYDAVSQAEQFVAEELSEDQKYVGTACLDIALNPVPGWRELRATSVTVIVKDRKLLGFSLLLNLGTRLGVFVAPNPGVTLVFNEQCDMIVKQARAHHESGRLEAATRNLSEIETKRQLAEIDWFDWLK